MIENLIVIVQPLRGEINVRLAAARRVKSQPNAANFLKSCSGADAFWSLAIQTGGRLLGLLRKSEGQIGFTQRVGSHGAAHRALELRRFDCESLLQEPLWSMVSESHPQYLDAVEPC